MLAYYLFSFTIGAYAWAQAIQAPVDASARGFSLSWEAVGSLFILSSGVVAMTWFVVSMAINSAIEVLRRELGDPERGFVPVGMCRMQHKAVEEELRGVKDSLR